MISVCTTPIAPMQGDLLNRCHDVMYLFCLSSIGFLLTLATKAFTDFVMWAVYSGLISEWLLLEAVSAVSQGTP